MPDQFPPSPLPQSSTPTGTTGSRGELAKPAGIVGFFLDLHNKTIFLRLGDWIFATYGVLASIAFMIGFTVALWYDAMTGQDVVFKAKFYLFFLLPSILMGCRAFSVLLEWRDLFRKPIQTLLKPGYMLHGGVFGAIACFLVAGWLTHTDPLLLLDAGAFAVPLGEAICRMGCYVYGCCWGRPTNGRLGVRYTSPHAKVVRCAPHLHGVKLHPAQVYGLVAHLAQFTVFYALLPYKAFDGMYAALFLITHPLIRFTLEYFRQDDRGRLWGSFTHTNLYSAIMIVLGVVLLVSAPWQGNTEIATNVRWIHILGNWTVMPWVALIGFVCFLAYGVHYKSVGSWLGTPSGGVGANVDELSMGAAQRLERVLHGDDGDHAREGCDHEHGQKH